MHTHTNARIFLFLFFLVTMSILQSCSKDTYGVVDSKSQDGKITFEMLKQQIGQPSLEKKVVISTNKNSNKSYSFTIDTTSIKKLTRERVVYSMVVSPNFIEDTIRNYNLLYFEKNGKMQQLLIKFVPTITWEVNYKKGIKRPFEGKMIAVSNYNLSKGTSKSTSQGELAICYQTNPIWLCNCANHRLGDPQCTCDTGFSVNTETTIVPCELSGGGGADPTSGDTGYGGGSLNPDGSTFNPDYPVFDDINYINKLKTNYFWDALGDARRIWVNSNDTTKDIYAKLINYQIEQNWTIASREYCLWAIEFFQENTETTWEQFENWYLTSREGNDGDYDALYWENPNLTFPQQQLPTFQSFDNAYPRVDGASLIQLIGGNVEQAYINNPDDVRGFCALKVSRGLNHSGVNIPNIQTSPNKPGTVLGGDGKYYFLNAKALNAWMRKTFGVNPQNPNHIRITASQGGSNGQNYPKLTAGIKGIYSMVSNDSQWASGHADLINNSNCVFGCHFYDTPPAPIDYIDIWILN
ncbi:T6SS effector amidase Tae4 family protein [Flavobacterium sp. XS2P24]|uniref:T6SS effector amidase Tae4 family protein n=1 Tax=Flavobacterium sp. XS2P24 TaxID=3041249 RepID=UPI0024A9ACDE|nr:T6SS effector amidase Tae4 family protein [Flavobacterium sp. XS2P24]MDI6048262.1 T6SS effector amidase Tae4 family protein [Flavobacterium sp. XS2P24]